MKILSACECRWWTYPRLKKGTGRGLKLQTDVLNGLVTSPSVVLLIPPVATCGTAMGSKQNFHIDYNGTQKTLFSR